MVLRQYYNTSMNQYRKYLNICTTMCDNDLPLAVINKIWTMNGETIVYAIQAVANLDIYLQETFGANKKFSWDGPVLLDERNPTLIEAYSVLENGELSYEGEIQTKSYDVYMENA